MDRKDFEVSSPPSDGVSALAFSPTANYLAATSWDQQLRVWEVMVDGNTVPKMGIQHDAPLLTCAWSTDGSKVFAGGASKQGKLVDMATGQAMPYAQHDAPIRCSAFCDVAGMPNVLVTGSWDKTVKYWDTRSPGPVHTLALPERCYTMSVTSPLMVIGTAERHILIYDLGSPTQVYKQMVSPLKCQTRCVSNFMAKNGFAVSSVEGRVAIQYVEEKMHSSNFSFKCHREGNNAYSVNAISFHPTYGTFSTAGADGTLNFWDKDIKQRLKSFNSVGAPISYTTFNRDGTIFAYAASYDWSKGHEHHRPDTKNKIFLHAVQDDDIKPRANPKKR